MFLNLPLITAPLPIYSVLLSEPATYFPESVFLYAFEKSEIKFIKKLDFYLLDAGGGTPISSNSYLS